MIPLLLGLGLLAGCADETALIPETQETAYQRGQRLLQEGRGPEALAAFRTVIDKRPDDAPESHLEVGRLLLSDFNDPVGAIYHFRRYLERQPGSEKEALVRQLIQTSQKEFARTLPGGPLQADVERLDLLQMLEAAHQENTQLKQKIADMRAEIRQLEQQLPERVTSTNLPSQALPTNAPASQPPSTSETPSNAGPQPEAPYANVTSYTVASGDSLYTIARKVYGSTERWMDLYQANRDRIPSPHNLRVGQTLRIPR